MFKKLIPNVKKFSFWILEAPVWTQEISVGLYVSVSLCVNLVELGKASPMTVFKQAYLYVILSQLSLCAF